MRSFTLPLILAASFGLTTPVVAQNDFGDVLGGIAQSLIQQEQDRNAYIAAQEANTVRGYRNYLTKYPKGKYRTNAEQALARLGAPVDGSTAGAAQAEARLGITFSQRVAVQRRLNRLGYRTYGADGVWGRNTRNAIATWQRDTGAKVTGYLTEAQLRVLVRDVVVIPPDDDTAPGNLSAAQVEASLRLTRTQRIDIQRQLTKIGYNTGVADGLWGSRTRAAISTWQKANRRAQTGYVTAAQVKLIASQAGSVAPVPDDSDGAALEERLLGLTVAERADLQRRLIRLGYPTNRTDGVFGPVTRRAIAEWQADEGEPVTGYLSADQVRLIRVETGG
jgi:peptidoglycan hydrolase-like protein with peptidoglycan-binding domain